MKLLKLKEALEAAKKKEEDILRAEEEKQRKEEEARRLREEHERLEKEKKEKKKLREKERIARLKQEGKYETKEQKEARQRALAQLQATGAKIALKADEAGDQKEPVDTESMDVYFDSLFQTCKKLFQRNLYKFLTLHFHFTRLL